MTPSLDAQLEQVARAFLTRRPWVVGPLGLVVLAVLFTHDVPSSQRAAALTALTTGFIAFSLEAIVVRARPIGSRWLFASLTLTLLAVTGVTVLLGGLRGPFVPMLFAPTTVAFAAFGVSRRSVLHLALTFAALASMALAGARGPFPPLPDDAHRWVALVASVAALTLAWLGVGGLSSASARAHHRLERASTEVVAAAHARVRNIEELSGHFSHELKNPLAALRAIVELMQESAADEQSQRRLRVAVGEVARLDAVVTRGLDFSRPAAGGTFERADVLTVVREVVDALAAYAEQKGVGLATHGAPVLALIDSPRVKEAVVNLALNAIEAAPSGTTVTCRVSTAERRAQVEVLNHGPAMTTEALERVGTPFFTTRSGGTGLGVAMARVVAAQHGGTLRHVSDDLATRAILQLGEVTE